MLAQDNSLLRRGGPCAHITFGVATAINAGTAAYFLGEGITRNHPLTDTQRLRVYELYFTCLRGSHVGQVCVGGRDSCRTSRLAGPPVQIFPSCFNCFLWPLGW